MQDSLAKYHYHLLSRDEKAFYEKIQKQLTLGRKKITIRYTPSIHKILKALREDSAELYFVNWQAVFTHIQFKARERLITWEVSYLYEREVIKRIEARIQRILQTFSALKSESAIALAVHDWLANNVTYDQIEVTQDAFKFRNHNAVGALISQKAVCEGFARAYQLLLNRLGVDCMMVCGKAEADGSWENGLHAWNIVCINGKNYYVDVTWDAASYVGDKKHATYSYYCLSKRMISVDHECRLPIVCNSRKENLFYKTNRVFSSEKDLFAFFKGRKKEKKGAFVMIDGIREERVEECLTKWCDVLHKSCQYIQYKMNVWYIKFF